MLEAKEPVSSPFAPDAPVLRVRLVARTLCVVPAVFSRQIWSAEIVAVEFDAHASERFLKLPCAAPLKQGDVALATHAPIAET